jgi:hypothetical protein
LIQRIRNWSNGGAKTTSRSAIPPRRYDSTVDRAEQILWPDEPQPNPPEAGTPNPNHKGYTGRWGPRVAADPETRRSGMRFPLFWLLFFEELAEQSPLYRPVPYHRHELDRPEGLE